MKRLVYTISFLLIACSAFTQDLTDALRYSNYHLSGTARSAAMGNAFGALGGDFSSLSINPAGVGVYRAGEFTITPSLGQSNVDGTYLGNKVSDSKYNISLDNIGYVANFNLGENSESGLVSINVGLGFNKLGSFTMSSLAEGFNSNHSLLTEFTNNANNGGNPLASDKLDNYYERLAWDTYVLNYDKNKGEYFNDLTDSNYGQAQRSIIDRRGYINEYLLAVAANFNHRFYLGATLGIHDVYYKENADLYEWDDHNNIPYFNNFNFNTYLKTAGTGVNMKFGAILKPIDQLRLGFAFHTPTFYKLNDLYDSGMKSSITYDDGKTENYSAVPDKQGVYDYEIETPMKFIASGALVVGKAGLVSVDYEFVDYSTAKLKNGTDYNYYDENQTIKNAYKSVGNIHLGAELKLDPSFSLRGGYEYFPSVYKKSWLNQNNPNLDASYSTFAGGFGYRQGGVFFDVAYKRIVNEENAKLYPGAINMAKYETSKNNVVFTLGFRF
ncbi:MAG: OmpP1/FadL family transporter [Candidatus Saccharibacteria bacterium]